MTKPTEGFPGNNKPLFFTKLCTQKPKKAS